MNTTTQATSRTSSVRGMTGRVERQRQPKTARSGQRSRLRLCYIHSQTEPSKAPSTGLAARRNKAQQAARRTRDSGFFHVLMLREAARCIQIPAARPARPACGLAVRAGHPRGCAGSLFRSANPHGLPPILGGVGGRF